MFASTTLGRVIAVLGQIGIGWLLTPADFGVWALALSMSTAVMSLRNGGTTQILIQRGPQFGSEAAFFLRYSLLFNVFAASILVGLSTPYLLTRSTVGIALLGIAIAVPLATPAMLYRAKLTIDHRFGALAGINFGSAALWQVSVFTLACLGFGAVSFACAPILQAAFETLAGRLSAGKLPRESSARPRADYVALFRQSSWVMLSAAVLSLGTTGDYFAVGMLTDMATVGIYYFAFQTVVTLTMPIYSGLESVLPTMLVKLGDDPPRQVAALARAMRTMVIAALPLVMTFALAVPFVIHLLWYGKWDSAARPTQILSACVPAWLILHATRAFLEARGYWRLRFGLLALNGVGGITAAAIGTFFGSVTNITVVVSTYYVSLGLGLVLALHRAGMTLGDVTGIVGKPAVLNCAALAMSLALRYGLFPEAGDSLAAVLFVLLSAIGNAAMFKPVWMDLLGGLAGAVRARTGKAKAVEAI